MTELDAPPGHLMRRRLLLRDSDRVKIRNEITEGLGDLKHWAFSFNLDKPDVHRIPLTTTGAVPATFSRQQLQTYRLQSK